MTCESAVFCEGYFDRAFWKGWLTHLGCVSLFEEQRPVRDPWGRTVGGGQFGFRSVGQRFIRVVPCQGKEKVLALVRLHLQQRATNPLYHVVVNWDADTFDQRGPEGVAPRVRLSDIVGHLDPAATPDDAGGYLLDGDPPTTLSLVLWEAADDPDPGLPSKQTLERLCCAAIREVYPARGEQVARWLDDLTGAPPLVPKSFSWSYMAGWSPEHNCEAFFELLWKDADVAAALQARLEATGAWNVAKALSQ